jgi:hypothetical protein
LGNVGLKLDQNYVRLEQVSIFLSASNRTYRESSHIQMLQKLAVRIGTIIDDDIINVITPLGDPSCSQLDEFVDTDPPRH